MAGQTPGPRVLVVGSANVDLTVTVARLPAPGETVTEGTLLVNHGGKGANQAVAARRLGAAVRFIGCVGDDQPGREIRAALAGEDIGVAGVFWTRDAATGTALIVVDRAGQNQIAVAPGANRKLRVGDVRARVEDLEWAQVVLCQLEIPLDTVAWTLGEARRRGVPTILNPAPAPEGAVDVFPLVDYLTPNAGEASRLAGVAVTDRASAIEAGAALCARGLRTVIITLGENGAVACREREAQPVPAFPVSAVDTTAAGDAFSAALAVAIVEGQALVAAVRFASAVAALACTRRGAQDSLPTRREVDAVLGVAGGASGGQPREP
jgi:ribokinase